MADRARDDTSNCSHLFVGQEVEVVGHKGRVAYIGPTTFAPGAWIGIDLKETVGKNDGCVAGKRYFTCQPNHGLFVRSSVPKPLAEAEAAHHSGDSSGSDSEEVNHGAMMVTASQFRRCGVSAESVQKASGEYQPPVHAKPESECRQLRDIIRTSHDTKLQMMFGSISQHTLTQIIDAMFLKTVSANEHVIEEGEIGDYFYIVKSGHFDIIQNKPSDPSNPQSEKRPVKVFEAGAGFAFGELALLYNAPRSATVTSTMQSEVWCLERTAFQRLIIASERRRFEENQAFLRKVEIFAELNGEQIASLAEVLQEESFQEDEAIVEQDDRDSNMYILRTGEAVACIRGDQGEVEVQKYTQGDFFGEIALLLGEPRKASVYAVGPVTCLYLSRETFNRILGPLRDFLEKNIQKYQKYQDAIEQAPREKARAESMHCGTESLEVFDGGMDGGARAARSSRKRDHSRTVKTFEVGGGEGEGDGKDPEPPASLKEKVEQDFKNPALVTVVDRFIVKDATILAFGGLRLGEKFKLDKTVVLRSAMHPAREELEDTYTWKAPTWLSGSTHIAVLCQKGQKSASDPTPNQDNYFIMHRGMVQIYGICDGHGPFGHLVSFRLVQTLPHFLVASQHYGRNWQAALREAFLEAQQDLLSFCAAQNVNVEASGAAGSILVFEGPRIHVAHIGDAGAMVGSWNRHDSHLVYGSKDHKPQVPEESARLEAAGSEVRKVDEDSYRIYIRGTDFPGLTMSRAFGDTACAGVLQEPEYKEILLQPKDEYYAVVASDGIWEFIEYDKAVDLSAKKLRLKGPRETARFLVDASRKRWEYCCGEYCDDITAIVVQWNVSEKDSDTNFSLTLRRHE